MAADPVFAVVPRVDIANIATANANRDGTGTVGTVLTAVAAGTKIEEVTVTATVTTTAGMVRLFLHTGSTFRLLKEIAVSAVTVSASVPAFTSTVTFENLVLPSGFSLRASTEKAESINVHAFGADLT